MKKCKILPFQNHQFDKNSVFRPFFVNYPLLPADMINFLLSTVSAISFAPEKVVRTWGEPQKKSFFTNIWLLPQIYPNIVPKGISSKKRDNIWKFWSFFDMIGVRTYCFDDISPNMHHKDEKRVKFCLFKMINLTKIAFLDLILPISRYFPQICSIFG